MKGCKDCPAFAKCTEIYRGSGCAALHWTYGIDDDTEIITNADWIRAMSDKELAKFLCDFRTGNGGGNSCNGCIVDDFCRSGHNGMIRWLQEPKED